MLKANWIEISENIGDITPIFAKDFELKKEVKNATLKITSRGVYEAKLNGRRVGDFILAPGWTAFHKRIQFQEYDVTKMLKNENRLEVHLGRCWNDDGILHDIAPILKCNMALIAEINIEFVDGTNEIISTDETWKWAKSPLLYCHIYNGIIYDANIVPVFENNAIISSNERKEDLISQEGEKIIENERLSPIDIITTPKGETVIDFGQNMTGYLEITVDGKSGDKLSFSFAEILDFDGNFYNENYRSAKCLYEYTCRDGVQTYKPNLTFYGFRYVRLDNYPYEVKKENFTAIVVHSELKRTGYIKTSNKNLNQLFHNVIWGQKSNYLDVPTDCPQRDERLGWTGDAQVFIKTAAYNYDVRKFFKKWLNDLKLEQKDNGGIPRIIPNAFMGGKFSAAWGDAVSICPWQIYMTYGEKEFLTQMFEPMKKWVGYITDTTTKPNLWFGGEHYGDWLELKAKYGECKGETRDDLVASAFYARSCEIICRVGKILGEDISYYEDLYSRIVEAFNDEFGNNLKTQTEYILPLYFGIAKDREKTAKEFVKLIHSDGDKIQTGFVGTPYILHVLSDLGEYDLAYKLLLREEYPSWLYPVTMGATTIWEHWDGLRPDGKIWPASMNSYNHYSYGAVADWMYSVCGGINPVEDAPGYEKLLYKPIVTDKLDFFEVEFESVRGKIHSKWENIDGKTEYTLETPVPTTAIIDGKTYELAAGTYKF